MIRLMRHLGPAILTTMLLAACPAGNEPPSTAPPGPTAQITTDEGIVDVAIEVADEPEERQQGLMGRRELAADAGMVFLYEEETDLSFWMKNTLIPLSVAAWDDTGRITTIADMTPCRSEPCEVYPLGRGVGALEVNEGFFAEHGVEVGDRIRIRR